MTASAWPAAEVDGAGRLIALAAGLGAPVVEAVIDVPFERLWAVGGDIEHGVPRFVPDIRGVTVRRRTGDGMTIDVRGFAGLSAEFHVVVRRDMWLMQSPRLIGGLAAVPAGEGTRVVFLGAFRSPGLRCVRIALRPVTVRFMRHVLHRLERLAAA